MHDEITRRARAKGIPMPDLNEIATIREPLRRYCFPNVFLLARFGNMAAYRIRPLTAETTLFEIWSLILYPEGEKRERPIAPTPIPRTIRAILKSRRRIIRTCQSSSLGCIPRASSTWCCRAKSKA